jgi:hypothetical protein
LPQLPNYVKTDAPHELPPEIAVKESGNVSPHDRYATPPGGFAPGPIPPATKHPVPVPIQHSSPDDFALYTDPRIDGIIAAFDHIARVIKEPRAMPWEYRGPLYANSTGGEDVQLQTVPPGEIWEIERLVIESGNEVVWLVYRNLVALGNLEDVSPSGPNYVNDYSPPIRLGAGEHLIVHGASQNAAYSVHVQYRFVRIPKPGTVLSDIPKVESLPREP